MNLIRYKYPSSFNLCSMIFFSSSDISRLPRFIRRLTLAFYTRGRGDYFRELSRQLFCHGPLRFCYVLPLIGICLQTIEFFWNTRISVGGENVLPFRRANTETLVFWIWAARAQSLDYGGELRQRLTPY